MEPHHNRTGSVRKVQPGAVRSRVPGVVLRHERRARARAEAVARITRVAASRHEPESLLQAVAPELLAVSGAARAVLYLREPSNAALVRVADAGTRPSEDARVRTLRLDLGGRSLARLAEGRPLAFQEGPDDLPGSLAPFRRTRSLLVIPLMSRTEVLGAVSLAWLGRRRHPDVAFVDFLADLCQQVAMGVENARLFATLAQMASTDELTGLANRRRFAEAFRLELARVRRIPTPLSLVLVDVDHLKRINDTLGHPAGDAAIRHVAEALRRGCREIDLPARIGGEEFALLLPDTSRLGAARVAERIRRTLAESRAPGVESVTASFGVATCPEDGADEEAIVRKADRRLYDAKSGGRDRVCSTDAGGGASGAGLLTGAARST